MKITSSKTMKEVSLKKKPKKPITYKIHIILLSRRYLTSPTLIEVKTYNTFKKQ